jgi:hypothetical protein
LPSSARDLQKDMLNHFTINSDPLWSVLEADAMQIAVDAVANV